ncbi:MAG: hypothetical protein LBM38_06030 [Clostridiales bacterium]|jgi:hypothetical protein|nr:hypothetical protein [Clostridiales bacterium]
MFSKLNKAQKILAKYKKANDALQHDISMLEEFRNAQPRYDEKRRNSKFRADVRYIIYSGCPPWLDLENHAKLICKKSGIKLNKDLYVYHKCRNATNAEIRLHNSDFINTLLLNAKIQKKILLQEQRTLNTKLHSSYSKLCKDAKGFEKELLADLFRPVFANEPHETPATKSQSNKLPTDKNTEEKAKKRSVVWHFKNPVDSQQSNNAMPNNSVNISKDDGLKRT